MRMPIRSLERGKAESIKSSRADSSLNSSISCSHSPALKSARASLHSTFESEVLMASKQITDLLGADADSLLNFKSPDVSKDLLQLPGPDFVDRVMAGTDRRPQVLRNFQQII